MKQYKLDRLSELTRISRTRELTDNEKQEREVLRNEYRESIVGNLRSQLESVTIIEPDGSKIRVKDRKVIGEEN